MDNRLSRCSSDLMCERTSKGSRSENRDITRALCGGLKKKEVDMKLREKDNIIAEKDNIIAEKDQKISGERQIRQELEEAVEKERQIRQELERTVKDLQEKLRSAKQENRNMHRDISEQLKDLDGMAQQRWKSCRGHFEASGWEGVQWKASSIQRNLEKWSNSSLNSSEQSTSEEMHRTQSF